MTYILHISDSVSPIGLISQVEHPSAGRKGFGRVPVRVGQAGWCRVPVRVGKVWVMFRCGSGRVGACAL